MKNIFVWTHHDLDGLVSYLAIKWAFPDSNITYQTTGVFNFRENVTNWLLYNSFSDFDEVYIVDLDISEHSDLVDKENVFILDHHYTHEQNEEYQFATAVVTDYSSAAKLIYRTFRKWHDTQFTREQTTLILLADDYDSYNKETEDSTILNTVFWSTQNNFATLADYFKDGFSGFTEQQLNLYRIYNEEVEKTKANLQYFEHKKLQIGEEKYHIISTFATKYINDIADHLFENYDPDIAIVVNMNSNHVSFRANKDCKLNVGKLAEVLTDGGGHDYAAGGQITKRFLEFTKKLSPRYVMRKKKKYE
jgi:oligoribonuclease NrnB/cAMP/cGMP phosphodiesterase (DHH superfamily)